MRQVINLLTFICVVALAFPSQGQSLPTYESPGDVLMAFFGAISNPSIDQRTKLFNDLFIEQGTVHTVIQRTTYIGNVKGGSYLDFLSTSAPFYEKHTMNYDEVERSIDYYVDMAAVHSLVYQSIKEKANPATLYEQMLWFNFSLVYQKERWYLTDVSWVNAYEDEDIDDAMRQDTLWHTAR